MPIYEYQCSKCGLFECSQRITDKPIKHCPTCGSNVSRIISRTSFVLKGSGWYATDYARNGSKQTQTNPTADAKGASANEAPKAPVAGSESNTKSSDKACEPSRSAEQQ
jgi:putative FmdB family regulatory protein